MVNNAKVNMHTGEEKKENVPAKGFSIYYGFEHECPHGHRFLLSMKHLDQLDSEQPGKQQPETLDVLEENFPNGCLNGIKNDHNLLNRDLPIYMRCPHCENSTEKRRNMKFANSISQLQRIFLVTPPFPVVIATRPIIQFAESCLPPSAVHQEKQSQFSVDSRVILPPESFLSFRLPFVYGVELDGQDLQPLNFMEQHPEQTAWLVRGTAFQVVSKGVSGEGSWKGGMGKIGNLKPLDLQMADFMNWKMYVPSKHEGHKWHMNLESWGVEYIGRFDFKLVVPLCSDRFSLMSFHILLVIINNSYFCKWKEKEEANLLFRTSFSRSSRKSKKTYYDLLFFSTLIVGKQTIM